jgi:hypothetical protein
VTRHDALRHVLIVCSPDPYAAAELAALIKEQTTTLVEEMSKKRNEEKHRAAESDDESNESDDDNASANANKNKNGEGDSDEDSDEDDNPYGWIGKWIQKPKGECCWKSKDGREGFMTVRLLKRAKITKEQYSLYKVRLRFTFGRTADSPQKTAHWLIGRFFDITKSYRTNTENHANSWALIVEKVRPI